MTKFNAETVKAEAESFASKAGLTGKWSQEAHVALVARLVAKTIGPLTAEQIVAVIDLLSIKGLGGNASQFSQFAWPKDGTAATTVGNRYAAMAQDE